MTHYNEQETAAYLEQADLRHDLINVLRDLTHEQTNMGALTLTTREINTLEAELTELPRDEAITRSLKRVERHLTAAVQPKPTDERGTRELSATAADMRRLRHALKLAR